MCQKKKTELIEENKNFSQIYDSSSDSSSQKKKNSNNEIKSSFHSSTVIDSINSNNLKQSDVFNSLNEDLNIKKSSIQNDRSLSGCEAPLVQELKYKEDNDEKRDQFYTNKGDDADHNDNIKYVPNPFLK